MKSNEFNGETLEAAVRQATAAYARTIPMDRKDVCSDLAIQLSDFKRQASDTLRDLEDLERDLDQLRNEARRAALEAAVGAAIAASGGVGTAIRALRTLKRLKKPDMNRQDWLSLVPLFGGGLLAALKALESVNKFREADRLAKKTERLHRTADQLGDDILRIASEYRRSGCAAENQVS